MMDSRGRRWVNMKNLFLTLMSSCISFVSKPPAAGHQPCFLFLSSKTLERCFPAFVGIASITPRVEGPVGGWERLDGIRERDEHLFQDAWTQGTAAI